MRRGERAEGGPGPLVSASWHWQTAGMVLSILAKRITTAALLVVVALVVLLALLRKDAWSEQVSGAHYRGLVNGVPVSLFLPASPRAAEGRVYDHFAGELRYFAGDARGSPWLWEGETEAGWLRLKGESNGACVVAWSATSNGPQRSISFERVADNLVQDRSTAIFVGRGMLRTCYRAERPRLAEMCDQELQATDRKAADEFVKVSWGDMWDRIRYGGGLSGGEGFMRRDVMFASSNVISLLEGSYEYSGGAHGMFWRQGRNWHREGGQWSRLELEDLFMKDSDWRQRLGELVKAGLVRQGASGVVSAEGEVSGEAFEFKGTEPFTVNEFGVTIHYSPYEVGSYAEGCFGVFVPFEELQGLLQPRGPLRHLWKWKGG